MKTCQKHNYNPPSRCPNCRIHKRKTRKTAAAKGWETRRANTPQPETVENENINKENEEFANHGWLS